MAALKKLQLCAAALAATSAASPAHATQSISCQANIDPRLQLDLVIGQMVSSVIAQARLSDGDRTYQSGAPGGPVIAQAWIDEHALHLDLTDANGTAHLARLRTWRASGRGTYSGSLRYAGRQYQMRCRGKG